MRADNILGTIGNTPHIRVNNLFPSTHEVWIKQERVNPASSIKDRIGLSMIEAAEADRSLCVDFAAEGKRFDMARLPCDLHHKIKVADRHDLAFDPDNCQFLCRRHHNARTARGE